MKKSVAIAAYNGEGFISEQVLSILPQLDAGDEVIVSVDPCTDKTLSALNVLASVDSRLKIIEGRGEGLIKNFENALSRCTGDVIFLSDQDDVWKHDKVSVVMEHFKNGADLVLHNCSVTDTLLNVKQESFFSLNGSAKGFLKNLIKNSYMGCCMAFRKEILDMCIPFPDKIPMHDQWIGLVAERCGAQIELEDKPLILYRRHEDNASQTGIKHASVFKMIKWRLNMISALKNVYRPVGGGKRNKSEVKQ